MPHCCDLQIRDEQKIQGAIETLRSILKAAENGNQAGEDAAVLAVAAPEMRQALSNCLEIVETTIDVLPGGHVAVKGLTLASRIARAAITQATAR